MSKMLLLKNHKPVIGMAKNNTEYTGCYHNGQCFFIKSTPFSASAFTIGNIVYCYNVPFGVIAVDNTITKDNSIRVVALKNMSCSNPDNGTLSNTSTVRMACGFKMNASTYQFTGPTNQSTFDEGVDTFIDGHHDHAVLLQATDDNNKYPNWRTDSTIPKGTNQSGTTGGNRGFSDAAMCSWRYNPISSLYSTQGYWYVPSLHELIIAHQHLSAINDAYLSIQNDFGSSYSIGRMPYTTSTGNEGKQLAYWASAHTETVNSTWGGANAKYNIYSGQSLLGSYSSGGDLGLCIPFIKFNIQHNKLFLDETYHIN